MPLHAASAATIRRTRRSKIDVEIKRILTDAHNEARRVLRDRGDILDELSRRLLDKEVMEGDELRELLGVVPAKDPDGTIPAMVPDAAGLGAASD